MSDPGTCRHCGLPVPRGMREFCCAGCAAVHQLLRDADLEQFYELGGGIPIGGVPKPRPHDWLPDLEADSRLAGPVVRITLDVQGIHCAACVWVLQQLWRRRQGALRIDINPSLGQAVLTYDRDRLALGEFLDDVERLGYRMAPATKRDSGRDRALLIRLGICAALSMNAMLFALSSYVGLAEAGGPLRELFRWLSFAIATATVAVGGPVFFTAALAGLGQRVLHLDLPISVGIALAYAGSVFWFFAGGGESYFDTVTVFVTLMLVGRYLQQRAIARNRDYLLANDGGENLRVRVRVGDSVRRQRIAEVLPGDELLLAPGELVPVRAELVVEAADFSLDWISGESVPRRFGNGEVVPAGAFFCGRTPARLRALATAEDSGLMPLLRTPEGSTEDMRGRGRFWQLLNRGYVVAVLCLAALGGLAWLFVDAGRAVGVATSILVVTCPCALGLATPLAFDLVLAGLRRAGVYVRSAGLLEKLRWIRRIVFDKTGTLTWGGLHAEVIRAPAPPLRPVLYSMAAASNHPVSRAVAESVAADERTYLDDLIAEETPGRGLSAIYRGHEYRLGSTRFVLGDSAAGHDSMCVFARDGQVEACFHIEEDYRRGFHDEIRHLRETGYELLLLSGDRNDRVDRAASVLGFDPSRARGELQPEEKAEIIRRLDHDDTLMIGDGLNDAPAFDAAFCAGTPAMEQPVMPSRADFCVIGGGASAVRQVLAAGRAFHSVVRANLLLAGVYNLLAVSLCLIGVMTPLLCALLMPASSLALIGHTVGRLGHRSLGVQP